MSRLRLLKVVVQPVFVVDDGDQLREQPAQPVTVSPEDWPTFATTTFAEGMQQLQAQLDASPALRDEQHPVRGRA
jgi:hypothetical protein